MWNEEYTRVKLYLQLITCVCFNLCGEPGGKNSPQREMKRAKKRWDVPVRFEIFVFLNESEYTASFLLTGVHSRTGFVWDRDPEHANKQKPTWENWWTQRGQIKTCQDRWVDAWQQWTDGWMECLRWRMDEWIHDRLLDGQTDEQRSFKTTAVNEAPGTHSSPVC